MDAHAMRTMSVRLCPRVVWSNCISGATPKPQTARRSAGGTAHAACVARAGRRASVCSASPRSGHTRHTRNPMSNAGFDWCQQREWSMADSICGGRGEPSGETVPTDPEAITRVIPYAASTGHGYQLRTENAALRVCRQVRPQVHRFSSDDGREEQ